MITQTDHATILRSEALLGAKGAYFVNDFTVGRTTVGYLKSLHSSSTLLRSLHIKWPRKKEAIEICRGHRKNTPTLKAIQAIYRYDS